jgi:ABC-2 type transport system permease protein
MVGLGALYGALQSISYPAVAGISSAERLQFGQQMAVLGRQISYLAPLPVRVDTLGGYLQWRMYGSFLPIVFSFWGFMAGSGVIRGDEERGVLEFWLAEGISRRRLVAVRLLGLLLASASAIALTGIVTEFGSVAAGEPLAAGSLALASLPLVGLTLTCFSVGLVAGQLSATRRGAAGLAGGLVLALYLVDSLSRTTQGLRPFRIVSPFFYYDRTAALIPGGRSDPGATLLLFAVALVLTTIGAAAFSRRDLGSSLFRRPALDTAPGAKLSATPFLRIPVLRSICEQRIGLTAWLVGVGLMAMLFTSIARPSVDVMLATPGLRSYLVLMGGGNPYQAMIGFFWFGTLELLLAVYALTQVSRWTTEEGDGRLELVLSEPVPRWSVVTERAVALALTAGCLIAVGTIIAAVVAATQRITLDAGRLVEASALLLPFSLAFGMLGALLTAYLPRAAVVLLSAYAVASYLVQQFGLFLKWPKPIMDLSVFQLYGVPLANGVYWTGFWVMLAVIAFGLTGALILIQQRDIGR